MCVREREREYAQERVREKDILIFETMRARACEREREYARERERESTLEREREKEVESTLEGERERER